MPSTPVSLLERLRQPASTADWERFVQLYTPLLFRWAQQIGLQESDAADLVQEVFAILVQKLPEFTYDPNRSFRAWLRTVLMNKWRELLRRAAPAGRNLGPEALAEVADEDTTSWEEQEYRQQLLARALQLMQTDFQPTTWKACWEFVACRRSAEEVAAELGLTVRAVYLAKARVLRRLREELAGLLD